MQRRPRCQRNSPQANPTRTSRLYCHATFSLLSYQSISFPDYFKSIAAIRTLGETPTPPTWFSMSGSTWELYVCKICWSVTAGVLLSMKSVHTLLTRRQALLGTAGLLGLAATGCGSGPSATDKRDIPAVPTTDTPTGRLRLYSYVPTVAGLAGREFTCKTDGSEQYTISEFVSSNSEGEHGRSRAEKDIRDFYPPRILTDEYLSSLSRTPSGNFAFYVPRDQGGDMVLTIPVGRTFYNDKELAPGYYVKRPTEADPVLVLATPATEDTFEVRVRYRGYTATSDGRLIYSRSEIRWQDDTQPIELFSLDPDTTTITRLTGWTSFEENPRIRSIRFLIPAPAEPVPGFPPGFPGNFDTFGRRLRKKGLPLRPGNSDGKQDGRGLLTPDYSHLIFTDVAGQIVKVSLVTGAVQQLTTEGINYNITLRVDGNAIAFNSYRGNASVNEDVWYDSSVYVMNMDGSGLTRVTQDPAGGFSVPDAFENV
jgi:hypothetical protein